MGYVGCSGQGSAVLPSAWATDHHHPMVATTEAHDVATSLELSTEQVANFHDDGCEKSHSSLRAATAFGL